MACNAIGVCNILFLYLEGRKGAGVAVPNIARIANAV